MIVRCGRCRAELEVSGPGEFVCPACGTRNAVRDDVAANPYDVGGLSVPGGTMPPPAPPPGPEPSVDWSVCPECRWRFAHGETEQVTCPNCRATLERTPDGLRAADSEQKA